MRHIESDTYIRSWDVIQLGTPLCTHCVRQQSSSTPDNTAMCASFSNDIMLEIKYSTHMNSILTRLGERKEK